MIDSIHFKIDYPDVNGIKIYYEIQGKDFFTHTALAKL